MNLLNFSQIPFAVLVGWIMGHPMDLNFQLFETAVLFITVLVVTILLQVRLSLFFVSFTSRYGLNFEHVYFFQEGKSNYCKGMLLVLCYVIVAASFFVHVDASVDSGRDFFREDGV